MLRKKLKQQDESNEQIKRYNKKLLKYINKLKIKLSKSRTQVDDEFDKKTNSALYFKEQKISILSKKLKEKDALILSLKHSSDRLNIILSDIKNNVLLKKLPNLNYNVYQACNSLLNIQEGDIIMAEDPNSFSEMAITILKDKIGIIICKIQPRKSTAESLPFIFINAQEISIIEGKFFASAEKKSFETALKKNNILQTVIETYRKSRSLN